MGQNFLGCDRDQVLLLPPDLREWLPEGHLARFVIDAVDELDLEAVYAYYRQDGRGRPAHDPAMMLAVVLYAYSVGVTSSRQIARRCVEDVAFRVVAVNRQPDHCTISRFLIRHRDAVSELFFQVLALCQRAGMVRPETVAVDSTKMASDASLGQSYTLEGLRKLAARTVDEAVETDRREDELFGEKRGDELPQELADPKTRKRRIRELLDAAERELADAEQARAETVAEKERQIAETGKRKRGRPLKDAVKVNPGQEHLLTKKYNLTDPDSGIVHHRGMLMQGYAIQTTVAEGQVIVSVHAVPGGDRNQLLPAVQQADQNLQRLGICDGIDTVFADSGYWNIGQINELTKAGMDVLVPPVQGHITDGKQTRPETLEMIKRLQQPENKERYKRRAHIIEPVFAHIKHQRGITRLLRRGKAAVQAEVTLIATTHNLLKLYRHPPAPASA